MTHPVPWYRSTGWDSRISCACAWYTVGCPALSHSVPWYSSTGWDSGILDLQCLVHHGMTHPFPWQDGTVGLALLVSGTLCSVVR